MPRFELIYSCFTLYFFIFSVNVFKSFDAIILRGIHKNKKLVPYKNLYLNFTQRLKILNLI